MHDTIPDTLGIHVANRADVTRARRLTHDVYVREGYCNPQPGGELRHYEKLDLISETVVLIAEIGGEIVGTTSFTLDSCFGLHTDRAFPVETDLERARCQAMGHTLAASWRIVTSPVCRNQTAVLGALIGRGLIHLEMMGVDRLLCTFNPKHRRAWERILGMKTIAGPRMDPSVNAAPAILMVGDVPAMQAQWNKGR